MVKTFLKKLRGGFMKLFRKNNKIRNRKVKQSRRLYLYVIFGSVFGLWYFVAALIFELPYHWAFSAFYGLVLYVIYRFLLKNWRLLRIGMISPIKGKLYLYLNKYTAFEDKHKLRLIDWVYLRRGYVRGETKAPIMRKVFENKELSPRERKLAKLKTIYCPQQLLDGINQAILVSALIYAHNNIQVLDDDLRDVLELTDKNMLAFNLDREIDKCRGNKYKKYMDVGIKVAKELEGKL